MGLSYDPSRKKWDLVPEKADYQTDRPMTKTVSITRDVWTYQRSTTPVTIKGQTTYPLVPVQVKKTATVNVDGGYWDVINALNAAGIPNPEPWEAENALKQAQAGARETNQYNEALNQQGVELKAAAEKKNNAYNSVISLANTTRGEIMFKCVIKSESWI